MRASVNKAAYCQNMDRVYRRRHPFSNPEPDISGLSDLVLVVEAQKKKRFPVTADLALEQGKEVFALPGRRIDPLSEGCNRLIARGRGS